MGKMNEIFVAVKGTDYIEAQIGTDDLDIRRATFDIVDMLCELKDIVRTMVPIKDLPSCNTIDGSWFKAILVQG